MESSSDVVPPSMQPFHVGFLPPVRPLGPCHNFGEVGHLKRTCPKPLGTMSPSTKYPNVECPSGEEKRQMRKVLGWLMIGWICGVTMTMC